VRWLWRLLRLIGDVKALSRGRLPKRLAWRWAKRTLRRAGRRRGWW